MNKKDYYTPLNNNFNELGEKLIQFIIKTHSINKKEIYHKINNKRKSLGLFNNIWKKAKKDIILSPVENKWLVKVSLGDYSSFLLFRINLKIWKLLFFILKRLQF